MSNQVLSWHGLFDLGTAAVSYKTKKPAGGGGLFWRSLEGIHSPIQRQKSYL